MTGTIDTSQDRDGDLPRLFRSRAEHGKATTIELFFDLVFVFAITQLAATLVHDLTGRGVAQVTLQLGLVWWAWNYATWTMNWLDPDRVPVRLMLAVTMLCSLLMSIAIPTAFADGGYLFAGAYVALQFSQNLFKVLSVPRGSLRSRGFERVLWWSVLSGVVLIAGSFADAASDRFWWWAGAFAIDLIAPTLWYWVPVIGASSAADWDIDPHHFAERFQLLVIVALGEGIVVIGSSAAAVELSATTTVALCVGFLTTLCMWWLYFDFAAEAASRRLATAPDPGSLARDGFTYLHLPIVAGIICAAVSLKLVIKHPHELFTSTELKIILAGPLLYLLGQNAFRLRMTGTWSRARLVAVFALVAPAPILARQETIVVAAWIAIVLVVLVVWESVSIRRWYVSLPVDSRPETLAHLGRYLDKN